MESQPDRELSEFKAIARFRGRRLWYATFGLLAFQVLVYLLVPRLIPLLIKPQVLLLVTPVLVALALVNYLVYCYAVWTCPACGSYPGADWRRLNPAPQSCKNCGVALAD